MALLGPALDVFKNSSWYWSLLQAFAKGCYNADLMLLLGLTTGLQRLAYTYYHRRAVWHESCQRCPPAVSFLRDAFSISRLSVLAEGPFENLRTVSLQARQIFPESHKESEISFETLFLISNLPLLSELRCCGLLIRNQGMTGAHQKQLSNLQSIVLQRTSIDSASLVTLVDYCKSLKRLEVDTATFRIDNSSSRQTIDFGSPEMALALERHTDTLESCALTNSQNAARVWAGQEGVSQMSLLKSFSIMRDLTVDEDHLLGVCVNKHDGETQHSRFFADQMRMWDAIDLNSILPPRLSSLRVHSWSHFSLLKGILTGMSKYGGSALRSLEVIFPCGLSLNREYRRSVESYKPYKDGAQPWLLDMVNREVSSYRVKDCIRFRIVGPSLASRLSALVRTMPNEGLVPPQQPVESESESEFESESDPEPDHAGEDDDSSEDQWPDIIEELSSIVDSEPDMASDDEALNSADSDDSGISADEEDSDD